MTRFLRDLPHDVVSRREHDDPSASASSVSPDALTEKQRLARFQSPLPDSNRRLPSARVRPWSFEIRAARLPSAAVSSGPSSRARVHREPLARESLASPAATCAGRCAGSTISDTASRPSRSLPASRPSTFPATWASLTMIDCHYGRLARDGREHATRLLDELSAGQRPRWTLVDAAWTPTTAVSARVDTENTFERRGSTSFRRPGLIAVVAGFGSGDGEPGWACRSA